MASEVSVRLDTALVAKLDALAAALGQPRTWVIEQAVGRYFAVEMPFLAAVAEGLHAADFGDVIDHAVIVEDLAEFRRRVAEQS